jgi:antibiotic biosynthesis monooxygenase (ABM) superfamily enzyme
MRSARDPLEGHAPSCPIISGALALQRLCENVRLMIARIWHGWTKPAHAKTYENLLRDEIFPSIAARNIKGYHGAELFIREDSDEVEFITLLRFDSMEAVKEFAGPDEGTPVIYPKAEPLLVRMERSRHYRIAID